MKRILLTTLLVAGLAVAAEAQPYKIVIEGTGTPPKITVTTDTPPPPPPPADRDGDGIPDEDDKCPDVKSVAPDGCPVKPPPPPPDETPFVWPAQPNIQYDDASARYTSLGYDPNWRTMGDFYTYYIALPGYANPLPNANAFACFYPGDDQKRVWAPYHGTPSAIRRVCAGGKP